MNYAKKGKYEYVKRVYRILCVKLKNKPSYDKIKMS